MDEAERSHERDQPPSSEHAGRVVAVAGATGNAGREVVRALAERGLKVRALVRDPARLGHARPLCDDIRVVQVTQRESIRGALDGADYLVSALGKTWQKDKTPRRAVDVDANVSLFDEAARAGVSRVGLITVAYASTDSPVAMLRMKGEVEQALRERGLTHVIIRPGGYFSDMWEVFQMCARGTFWAFGRDDVKTNPISLVDLGDFTAACLLDEAKLGQHHEIGGPDVFGPEELAALCARILERPVRVRRVPMWLAKGALGCTRPFSRDLYELLDFFIGFSAAAGGRDSVLPRHGTRHLEDYLRARYHARDGA
ncbi:MAG: SDR family oxidoreductase [Myxococcales bacterium]|nr:SDR family oxidoreductase [Myxococcales bacterium]